jgi:hypothetical protein
MYAYVSRHGDSSIFQDKICAVRLEQDGMRSACWLFTPLAMERDAMQEAFTAQLAWLDEAPQPVSSFGIQDRRERIERFLKHLSHFAAPEERERYGISLKPFELVPLNQDE